MPTPIHHPALDLFGELLAVPAPSGREERLAQAVRGTLEGWGFEPETDPAGNVIVRVAGRDTGPLLCLAAHMDEIGMVVTRVEPDGSLRVDRSGGLYPWKVGEGPVEVVGDNGTVVGVLSMGSGHAASAAEGVTWASTRIITGLSPQQLEAAGVRPGSGAVPVREGRGPVVFGPAEDPLVAAWTFDDRMGVVALLRLLQAIRQDGVEPRQPLLVTFTVREEGGCHGALVLAQRERPQTFVAIDGCPMPPGAPVELDGRPGIWSKDRIAHYDQHLLAALCSAAREAGTALQPVVYDQAASDASYVFSAGGCYRIACFGHVRENSHGYEVARLSVFDNVLRTLVAFVSRWRAE